MYILPGANQSKMAERRDDFSARLEQELSIHPIRKFSISSICWRDEAELLLQHLLNKMFGISIQVYVGKDVSTRV